MTTPSAVLVTRPHHDPMMGYLAVWSDEVLKIAKSKGINVCDLHGDRATRATFESYMSKHNPSFVILNGHGDTESVCGHENEVILDRNSNIPTCVMYARSCSAGETLGSYFAEKGVTFIGYAREFGIVRLIDKITRPLEDQLAAIFLEPSNLIISTLLKGHTAGDAHNRSREAMKKNFSKLLSSVATDEERSAAPVLWRNMKWQVLYGNSSATVV